MIWTPTRLQRDQPVREPLDLSVDWRPDVDIYENRDSFLICVALPGVTMGRIRVVPAGTSLAISGAAGVPVPFDATAYRMELPRGRFLRRINLPADVDMCGVSSQLRDGVLLIRVPRTRTAPTVSIQVKG